MYLIVYTCSSDTCSSYRCHFGFQIWCNSFSSLNRLQNRIFLMRPRPAQQVREKMRNDHFYKKLSQQHIRALTTYLSVSGHVHELWWTNQAPTIFSIYLKVGLSHLDDQRQRSRNARKNQPNAGERWHRWTIVMLSPCAFSDRCWSQMNADERWEFWTSSKLSTHTSVWEETLDERWVVVTQSFHTLGERYSMRSLYTLGKRYSIVVHARWALLNRCTLLFINNNRHIIYMHYTYCWIT